MSLSHSSCKFPNHMSHLILTALKHPRDEKMIILLNYPDSHKGIRLVDTSHENIKMKNCLSKVINSCNNNNNNIEKKDNFIGWKQIENTNETFICSQLIENNIYWSQYPPNMRVKGSRVHRYKDYIIVTRRNQILIYKMSFIKNGNNIIIMKKIKQSNYKYVLFDYHGSIFIPKPNNNNCNNNCVKLLLFGPKRTNKKRNGTGTMQFVTITVDFNKLDNNNNNNDNAIEISLNPIEYMTNIQIVYQYKKFAWFLYQLIDSRYLIIFGGKDSLKSTNGKDNNIIGSKILVYDFKLKIWYFSIYTLPQTLTNALRLDASLLMQNNKKLYVFASFRKGQKWLFKLNIRKSIIPWQNQRLIWIGFYKNDDNPSCMFKSLGKDIIVSILQFGRDCSIFAM